MLCYIALCHDTPYHVFQGVATDEEGAGGEEEEIGSNGLSAGGLTSRGNKTQTALEQTPMFMGQPYSDSGACVKGVIVS